MIEYKDNFYSLSIKRNERDVSVSMMMHHHKLGILSMIKCVYVSKYYVMSLTEGILLSFLLLLCLLLDVLLY